jgi:hypothetical protein
MQTRGIGIDFFALNDGLDLTSEASQATDYFQSFNDAIDPLLSIEICQIIPMPCPRSLNRLYLNQLNSVFQTLLFL